MLCFVIDMSQEGTLLVVVGQDGLGLGVLGDHVEVETFQDIFDVGDRVSAVLDKFVDACCTGREYARGYGKNFTTLIESRVGCDECSTSWGGFGNHDAKRKAGDEMVAGRKVSGFGPDAQGKGCEQCALS